MKTVGTVIIFIEITYTRPLGSPKMRKRVQGREEPPGDHSNKVFEDNYLYADLGRAK